MKNALQAWSIFAVLTASTRITSSTTPAVTVRPSDCSIAPILCSPRRERWPTIAKQRASSRAGTRCPVALWVLRVPEPLCLLGEHLAADAGARLDAALGEPALVHLERVAHGFGRAVGFVALRL